MTASKTPFDRPIGQARHCPEYRDSDRTTYDPYRVSCLHCYSEAMEAEADRLQCRDYRLDNPFEGM